MLLVFTLAPVVVPWIPTPAGAEGPDVALLEVVPVPAPELAAEPALPPAPPLEPLPPPWANAVDETAMYASTRSVEVRIMDGSPLLGKQSTRNRLVPPMALLQGFADLRSQGRLPSVSRSHGRAIGAAFSSSAARARSAFTCSRSVRGNLEAGPVCARAGAMVSSATMMNFDITHFNTHVIAMHAFHDRPTFHEASDERSPRDPRFSVTLTAA